MDYLEINISNHDFCSMVYRSIKNKLPLSLTRFGDGEVGFLDGNDNPLYEFYKKASFDSSAGPMTGLDINRWEEYLSLCVDEINKGLKNSDVIGTMTKHDEIIDMGGFNDWWRVKKKVFEGLDRRGKMLVCDHAVVRCKELGDANCFKKLLNHCDLNIISCRTNQLKSVGLEDILEANVYYTEIDEYTNITQLSFIYDEVNKIKEDVVIVALGALGKGIPQHLSSMGKVCLDYGSTIDAWAGGLSRQPFYKGQAHDYCVLKDPARNDEYYEQVIKT